jgi:yecA family protein
MIDLERLDSHLSSDDSPESCMLLSDLDGFLNGIACSPLEISAQEWMPVALGASPDEVPQWVLALRRSHVRVGIPCIFLALAPQMRAGILLNQQIATFFPIAQAMPPSLLAKIAR